MLHQKPPLMVKISSQVLTQFLSVKFIMYCLFNVNCQAELGEILQRHPHANPAFSMNVLGHTVIDRHLSERYTDKMWCMSNM